MPKQADRQNPHSDGGLEKKILYSDMTTDEITDTSAEIQSTKTRRTLRNKKTKQGKQKTT